MDGQCADVGTSFTADPESSQVALRIVLDELALVNSSNTKLSLNGGNQWWTLEQRTRQRLKCLCARG